MNNLISYLWVIDERMIQSDNEQFVTYIDVTYTVQTPNTIDINSCCCYAGKI